MRFPWNKKERTVGTAQGKRRYDLPLNKGAGTGFLTLLVGLMTFLAFMALTASFALSAMKDRWTSGLENRVTAEIPAENESGTILSHDDLHALTARVAAVLAEHPAVSTVHILSDDEIAELVKPWLGENSNLLLAKVPVPGLIGVEVRDSKPETMKILEEQIQSIAPRAHIDTHEEWLKDLLHFTGALHLAAALLTAVIGATAAASVAGAVRARMAVHAEEVEILHLMGAPDSYIAHQFQRHSLIIALQGSLAGTAAGGLAAFMTGRMAGSMGVSLLPGFHLSVMQMAILAILPVIAAALAAFTATYTVNTVLSRMP